MFCRDKENGSTEIVYERADREIEKSYLYF